jgi:hypothetical protein
MGRSHCDSNGDPIRPQEELTDQPGGIETTAMPQAFLPVRLKFDVACTSVVYDKS